MNSPLILLLQAEEQSPLVIRVLIILLAIYTLTALVIYSFRGVFNFFEMAYVEYVDKKLFFNHLYFRRKKLDDSYKKILKSNFSFYKKLTHTEQKYFEHRLCYFLKNWEFIGKEVEVTDVMKVMIAATAVKLAFGLRDYKIESVNKVIIYPEAYYSTLNKTMHKGEFNISYGALVFSWKDFISGYTIDNDNINLGVHECIHAIHFSFLKSIKYSTSAAIFLGAFHELTELIDSDNKLKEKLVTSKYFRAYAFENHFEFISVLAENFIETPADFRSQFPEVYAKVKAMLNFNFAGY
jgi:Mlc titration factor MtfA (ptsG expression regulator)